MPPPLRDPESSRPLVWTDVTANLGLRVAEIPDGLLGDLRNRTLGLNRVINPLAENRRILVVDDNDAIHNDFRKILCKGGEASGLAAQEAALFGDTVPVEPVPQFDLASAMQGRDAVVMVTEAFHEGSPFALAFVDMRMPPGWDGLVTIQHMWEVDPRLHIVICTAYTDYTSGQILRELGQTDRLLILKKPFEPDEVRLAAVTMTKKWQQAVIAQQQTEELEREVAKTTHHVHQTRDAMMFALAQLAESRDTETGQHLDRMREYSQLLARRLAEDGPYVGQIDAKFLGDLYRSSPLHDIGKVGIPDSILLKPGPLTPDEYGIMKQHVAIGASTIRGVIDRLEESSLQMAADVVEFHHERFDGSGYLTGMKGQEIPLAARIVALAEAFDAISSKRIYKEAIDPTQAREIILSERGKQFDPVIVDAFLHCFDEFLDVAHTNCRPTTSLVEV